MNDDNNVLVSGTGTGKLLVIKGGNPMISGVGAIT
jgi:hypothetical protein